MTPTCTLPGQPLATAAALPAAATPQPPRFDMYTLIHKALREAMARTLRDLGALDTDDEAECAAVLDRIDELLTLLYGHLQHENDFVHTAIEARQPGGALTTADDHLEHQEALHHLAHEVRALRDAASEQRPPLAQCLYRRLAVFVGENLAHMQVEETRNNAALWALYSDEELVAIHDRLVASIPPAEMTVVARWMAAALSVPELAMVYGDMQRKAPPPAFTALLGVARSQLDARRWARLAHALGLAPVPGLMTA